MTKRMSSPDFTGADIIVNLERLHVMQVKTLSTLDGAHRVLVKTTDDKGLEQLQEMIIRSENLLSAGEIEKQVLGQIRNLHAAAVDMSIGTFGFPDEKEAVAPAPPSSFLLDLLVDPKIAKDWRANAEELYMERWFIQHGGRKANVIWYGQILRLVVSQWLNPVMAIIDRVKRPHTS